MVLQLSFSYCLVNRSAQVVLPYTFVVLCNAYVLVACLVQDLISLLLLLSP